MVIIYDSSANEEENKCSCKECSCEQCTCGQCNCSTEEQEEDTSTE